ncbi:LacI family transcriptional regulator [Irregularibacter muris]|uniref:LacI family transcriptional regulator n=1 Tax=Irregularibacter muris TaxID=1796619 RepID=A0AAE3HFE2_9FIRM|nr:LacI family DNA-binding transcriptional regulator [Irregularibacter muris]MCR1899562.1 LacI family transcriptional regulator [Irregularibacter muris]
MPTIKDIAQAAGVSIATVSMALNGKKGISPKTRDRILDIAQSINYVPSAAARALKTKHSYTLGMIIGQLSNSYSIDIITAAEKVARERGYNIFILNAELSIEKTIECLRILDHQEVDGILVSVFLYSEQSYIEEIHRLMNKGIHVVSLTRNLEGYGIPVVSYKEDQQVYQSLIELIELGHRDIGLVAGPKGSLMNIYRFSTFNKALREYNLYNKDYITYSQLDMYSAKEKTIELLTKFPEITAIYAINDMIALGVLQAAYHLGLKVPQDLSILGTDGIPYVNFTIPNITTIKTPRYEIGKWGTEMLINRIESTDTDENEIILFPCIPSKGESVAYPPFITKDRRVK